MRLRPRVALFALTTATVFTMTGCGTSEEPASQPEPTAAAPTHDLTPGDDPTTTSHPTPASTPTKTEGDGDGEDDDTPATAGGGICGDLSASEVGQILGGKTEGAALPGGGCGFTLVAAKGPAATFIEKSEAKIGGMNGAKTEATSSVEGEPQNLAGIGDAAFVVTGTAFGEPAIQGAGAVKIGARIINVTVTQNTGMTAAAVKAMVVKLLRLAAAQA